MATNNECCSALGYLVDIDDEGNEICFNPGGTPDYQYVDQSFYLSNACAYAQLEGINVQQSSSGGGGFNFDSFTNNVTSIFDSIGGLLGGVAGLNTTPANPQDLTLQQAQDARQMRVIIGFVVVLGLIIAGVVISRRRK